MLQQKSSLKEVFKEDIEILFKRIIVIANIVGMVAILLQFWGGKYGELLFGLSFFTITKSSPLPQPKSTHREIFKS